MLLSPLPAGSGPASELGGDVWEDLARRQRQASLQQYLGGRARAIFCGCDQVGTPKLFLDEQGSLLKLITYDSFGNVRDDSWPLLFIPVGFAGGLADRDLGLTRFGWRDYDPLAGRFTAPDPLGDTGGDHDLYDYCVDDPVSMNDPSGLLPPLLILEQINFEM